MIFCTYMKLPASAWAALQRRDQNDSPYAPLVCPVQFLSLFQVETVEALVGITSPSWLFLPCFIAAGWGFPTVWEKVIHQPDTLSHLGCVGLLCGIFPRWSPFLSLLSPLCSLFFVWSAADDLSQWKMWKKQHILMFFLWFSAVKGSQVWTNGLFPHFRAKLLMFYRS